MFVGVTVGVLECWSVERRWSWSVGVLLECCWSVGSVKRLWRVGVLECPLLKDFGVGVLVIGGSLSVVGVSVVGALDQLRKC